MSEKIEIPSTAKVIKRLAGKKETKCTQAFYVVANSRGSK